MIYIFVLIILIFGVFNYDFGSSKDGSRRWLLLEWVVLVLLAGLRYRVGGDTLSYYDNFENIPLLDDLNKFDFKSSRYNALWIVFSSICRTICNDFTFLQVVHALIVNTTFFVFFKKHTNKVFTAILLYFCIYYFKYNTEILRASLAVCVFLWSYKYLQENKLIKYLICCAIAFGFHTEAFYMLLFPLVQQLSKIKFTYSSLSLIFVFSVAFMFSGNVLPFMNTFMRFIDSEIMKDNIQMYMESSVLGAGVSALGYLRTMLTALMWLLIAYGIRNTSNKKFIPLLILNSFIILQAINYSSIFYRAMDFTIPITLCALASCMNKYCLKSTKGLGLYVSLTLSLLILNQVMYLSDGHFILFYPYHSVLDPQIEPARELFYNALFNR